ncbi:MAG: HAMP domain-containing protein [Alphaproteobacteria bacterium]|nr:HAMP domain-containing protein [Alphaproteobacteria bacterium]
MRNRLLPRSLLARSLLIIVMPLVLLQLVSAYVFFGRHWDAVTHQLSTALVGDVAAVIDFRRAHPLKEDRDAFFALARNDLQLDVRMIDGDILGRTPPPATEDARLVESLSEVLRDRLLRPFTIDASVPVGKVRIRIQLTDGVLEVLTPRKRLFSVTTYLFVLWMVGSSMFLFGIASLFMRNQVRPIRRLAAATNNFGKGRDVPFFKPEGATEVRQAATAFNHMRARIKRQINQRTEMLAGVSHDLRTPLTRMKLQLAILEEFEGVDELNEDIAEMERLIESYLAFARGEGAEATQTASLSQLIETVAGRFRRNNAALDIHIERDLVIPMRLNAIERCLSNLIDNAARYGTNIAVRAGQRGDVIEVTIDDDGPGIPVSKRTEVFRAFIRLEGSRNPKTGGVGLGLTIALDIAHGHGGDILLEDSPLGGLRARLRLPI